MKIRKHSTVELVYKILLMFLVVTAYKFFFIFDNKKSGLINGAYGPSTKTLCFVSFLLLLVSCIESTKIRKKRFILEICVAEIIILIAALVSSFDTFFDKWMSYWVLLLLYLALTCALKTESRIKFFINALQICGIITNILLIAQATVMNMGGTSFLHIYFLESGYWFTYRNGLVRIAENEVLYLMTYCVSVSEIRKNEKYSLVRIMSWVNIGLTLVNFFYVDQTRMIIILALFILLVNVFVRKDLNARQVAFRFFLIIVGCFFVGYMWDEIVGLFHFSTTENSYTARVEGYKYFLKIGFEHPFCGIGFSRLLDSNEVNYTDVGIIGTFGQFGLFLTIAYILILIKMTRCVKNGMGSEFTEGQYLIRNLAFMTVFLSLSTMSMFNNGLLQVFAISLALIETVYTTQNERTVKKLK